jgi:hypothetical protein
MSTCPHCPDGHRDPESRHWGAWIAPDLDSDGQPTHLRVEITNGAHVAESDAEWVRQRLMAPGQVVKSGTMRGCFRVAGKCPACDVEALALGAGGYVTCASLSCPEPDAASKALRA